MRDTPQLARARDGESPAEKRVVPGRSLMLLNARTAGRRISASEPRSAPGWQIDATDIDGVRRLKRFVTRRDALRVAATLIATEPQVRL